MSAELGLAIIGAVDLCLKYGSELRKICSALKGAESEIEERALRLETGWNRCIIQLMFLKEIHSKMDESHRELHERTLHMLGGKLSLATSILKGLVTSQPVNCGHDSEEFDIKFVPKRVKYAFKKERLDEAIEALEAWQRLSDPSWFLILNMHDMRLDDALEAKGSSVTWAIPSTRAIRSTLSRSTPSIHAVQRTVTGLSLPAKNLDNMEISGIPLCDSRLARTIKSSGEATYILDNIQCPRTNAYYNTKKNMRDLASRLQHDEPENFGILRCKGFVAEMGNPSSGTRDTFVMVMRIPDGLTRPRSLRDILLNTAQPVSLSHRVSIAQEMARSIAYVHIFGFVHKNLRPETLLAFESPKKESPSIFLVGFEGFRKEEGKTERIGDYVLEKNLYRHPSRQGVHPSDDFVMQHDIYSLGVNLLEVGLWHSFVNYDSQGMNPSLSPLLGIPVANASEQERCQFLLSSAKDRMVALARTDLRRCMGTQYSDVVETCLTCLEPGNDKFGDQREFEDEDGIRVGVRYIEKVSIFFP
ncbi:hypothetical protein HD806DRAFT_519934 [Xylariaceae sp. AK1471]|nr:hypothetical protein HD806DRAFT_519934 [Xylariaceae sp. AK1471]